MAGGRIKGGAFPAPLVLFPFGLAMVCATVGHVLAPAPVQHVELTPPNTRGPVAPIHVEHNLYVTEETPKAIIRAEQQIQQARVRAFQAELQAEPHALWVSGCDDRGVMPIKQEGGVGLVKHGNMWQPLLPNT